MSREEKKKEKENKQRNCSRNFTFIICVHYLYCPVAIVIKKGQGRRHGDYRVLSYYVYRLLQQHFRLFSVNYVQLVPQMFSFMEQDGA